MGRKVATITIKECMGVSYIGQDRNDRTNLETTILNVGFRVIP